MKKIISILYLLYIGTIKSSAQQNTIIYRAYYYSVDMYNSKIGKYENGNHKPTDIFIFYTPTKFIIKDEGKDVFYIAKELPDGEMGGFKIFPFECYDKDGKDCIVDVSINNEGKWLMITYKKDYQITYSLELVSNGE